MPPPWNWRRVPCRHWGRTTAVLVVEVADTTVEFDRTRKQAIYARARIPEYWILNLVDHVLEVYRDPQESTCRTTLRLASGQSIAPLAVPTSQIPVSDLLP
jgi:Uma2 family endonuclease